MGRADSDEFMARFIVGDAQSSLTSVLRGGMMCEDKSGFE